MKSNSGSDRGKIPFALSMWMLAPVIVLTTVIFLYPVCRLLLTSFFDPSFTLANYYKLATQRLYTTVLLRTLWISAATTITCIILGYPVAVLMTKTRGIWTAVVTSCVLIPLWTSVLVRSYAWTVLLQRNGLINQFLLKVGIIDRPLTLIYTEGSLLIAMAHVLLPFMILPIYSALRNISPDLSKAGANLGAGRSRIFWSITLPLSMSGVFAGCVIVFILALGFYVTPALVGGPRTMMIATLIGQQVNELLNWPLAGAISLVLLVVALTITLLFRRFAGVDKVTAHV